MTEKSTLFLLQLALALNVIAAQIHFPDERNRPTAQGTASAPVHVPSPNADFLVSDLTAPSKKVTINEPESLIARGLSKLMLDINRVVPTTSPYLASANNLVYGPLSIAGALALVLLASVGQTYYEIANVLGFSSGLDIQNNPLGVHEHIGRLSDKLAQISGLQIGEQVSFGLTIFVQKDYPVRPAFQQASKDFYGSQIVNLDFRGNPLMAQNVINTWVSNRTNAKIPSILNDFPPPNTRAIVVGVLYFKAAWEFPFFDGHTKWRPFFVNGRKNPSDRMAEMMSNGGEFPYYKDTSLGLEIMGFPYKGKHSTMYVILPNDSNVEKLKKLENSLTAIDLERLINYTRYTEAVVLFPKMRLENTINLKPALQTLGINALFNPYQANLGLLSAGLDQRFNGPVDAPFVSAPIATVPSANQRPPSPPSVPQNVEDGLIFTRFGTPINCNQVYDPATNSTRCQPNPARQQSNQVRAEVPLSARMEDASPLAALESIRREVNANPGASNPGIYADQVIHKVFIDITESGTEAAAATGISLNRSGGRVTFRVDIPFLFFIYNEETKLILFWGSVKSPTPSVATPST